jgi:hypothetical protein
MAKSAGRHSAASHKPESVSSSGHTAQTLELTLFGLSHRIGGATSIARGYIG